MKQASLIQKFIKIVVFLKNLDWMRYTNYINVKSNKEWL